jgi:hypothetical protein
VNALHRAILVLIGCLAACVPAAAPPQLTHTPGQSVTITEETFANAAFALRYPRGWRVVTGAAAASPTVTLIAPGDCALIIVSAARIDPPPALSATCSDAYPDPTRAARAITNGDGSIAMEGVIAGGADDTARFLALFEQIAASLTPS